MENEIQILFPKTAGIKTKDIGMGFIELTISRPFYLVDNEATIAGLQRIIEFLQASKNTNGEPTTV